MATEFENWTEALYAAHRGQIPGEWADQLDVYLRAGQHRVLAHDLVKAALQYDDILSLSVDELERARIYNERGWFGRQAKPFFRELFAKADRLVAA